MDLEAPLTRRGDYPPFFLLQRKPKGKKGRKRKGKERGRTPRRENTTKRPKKSLKIRLGHAAHKGTMLPFVTTLLVGAGRRGAG